MNNKQLCHLHLHTEYSQLDGLGNVDEYATRAKQMGFKYLACTDHGNIDGLIKFQQACIKNDIIPILGCELYVVEDAEQSIKEKSKLRGHINVHVKSQKGFDNLCKMLTFANTDGFYYKPRVDYKTILENTEGLCFSTACLISFLRVLPKGKQFFSDLYDCVGKDLYCEIMPHRIKQQPIWNRKVIRVAKRYGLKVYATNDCHYVKRTQAIGQEVLLAIQRKALWSDKQRFKFSLRTFHLKSWKEMMVGLVEFGQYKKEYLTNTLEVAEKCSGYTIPKRDIDLPHIPGVPTRKKKEKKFLKQLCFEGFKKKFGKNLARNYEYSARVKEEYDLITKKNFERYFLMVWELINWCKENNILVGPGRGSVGGSLIAYLIGITAVDPIKHNLLFSRFINEDRIDYPDIDIDFEDSKRHLVRQHLESMYGEDNIAGVSSFNRMKARAALKDVGRVFGVKWQETDVVTKLIEDNDEHTGIQDAIDAYQECRDYAEEHPQVIKLAKLLEGTIRGYSQHAAALVVSKEPIGTSGRCNLLTNKQGESTVNWEKEDTEYVGLMKLDALGLKLLSILSETLRLIKENQGKNIDLEKININDKKVLKDINEGNTVGVFQLGTWATTNLVKEMGVDEFDHLSATVALVRPGPANSGMTEEYIKRKNGAKWEPMHSIYERITKDTYGLLVYQEQVMQVVSEIADLPYSTADKVRKIIGKKRDVKEFKKYKKMFVDGCKKTGYFDKNEALRFWAGLEKWSKYGFNKSHSVEYALLGYWCSWLKRYFPTEFICGSLTYGAKDKKAELVEEAYRLGLTLVLPKVGISHANEWTVKDKQLFIPFEEVNGIGPKKALMAAQAKPRKNSIKRFYKKKKKDEVERFGGAFGELLNSIGAYEPHSTFNVTDEVKKLFGFRITANPRDEYRKLYNLLNGKIRLDQLDDVLEADYITMKKIGREHQIIRKNRTNFTRHRDLHSCELCELIDECKAPVQFSPGLYNVMIVGEAPGPEEDKQREGFVGRSGDNVWKYLKSKGYTRKLFHVTNIGKCYPSKSRKPNKEQIDICAGTYLWEEIKNVQPKVILAFGNTGLQYFLNQKSGITDMSGRTMWLEKFNAWVVFCIHPAAALHNPDNKMYYEAGMKRFCKVLRSLRLPKK
jgi:DNA polymerase-3 subunit alpha